jgi:hypothetical protein
MKALLNSLHITHGRNKMTDKEIVLKYIKKSRNER